MFKKGQLVELDIVDMSNQGLAIGKADSMAVFVPGPIPGDKVTAKLTKLKKNYAFGDLVSVDEASPWRQKDFCIHGEECGGCPYGEIEYGHQLHIKEKQVRDKLVRLAGLRDPKVNPIIPMEDPLHYRNKATLAISTGGNIMKKGGIIENLGPVGVGFYEAGSHRVFHCVDCRIQSPAVMAAAEVLRRFMEEDNITAWDEKWKQGLMKNMVVKTGFATGEVMVVLGINGKGIPNGEKMVGMLSEAISQTGYDLHSVVLDNEKDLIYLAGKKTILEKVGDLEVEISPRSFFQVNPVMTEILYDTVCRYANLTGKENVLDLYCGIGTIGLYCAGEAGYVLGIEEEKQAILDANRNAVINGIVNAQFLHGRAEEVLPKLLAGEGDNALVEVAKNADVVILDPPRVGCHPALLDAVVKTSPDRIVYMSCDPGTLARDIKILREQGYEFVEATPADNFPWTNHVEVVALLTRKRE
ncbi:MAG: 23S rRNA (uracil(1939)-C(5))-methyltransferase RlmD [Anaerovoracaceae bacterium]|jgi:23S rRNA (uracil1939-C5)-methyltransferase